MPRKYAKREPEFPTDAIPEEVQPEAAPEVPVPVAPPPPNPAVIALQGDVVDLVRRRAEVRQRLVAARQNMMVAQSQFQSVEYEMNALDEEVQYIHRQVAQMEGRDVPITYNIQQIPQFPGGVVESVPTAPQQPRSFAPPDGINRGHAVREVL